MGYFDDITTEEELDRTCKELLIQNNYRAKESRKVVDRILKEYKPIKERMENEELAEAKKSEERRVSSLKAHKYTLVEIQGVTRECKQMLGLIIKFLVMEQQEGYVLMGNAIESLSDDKHRAVKLTRWFNKNLNFISEDKKLIIKYNALREVLEYACKSLSTAGHSEEEYMLSMERSLGEFMESKFREYEDEYIDPIKLAIEAQTIRKDSRFFKVSLNILGDIFAILFGFIVAAMVETVLGTIGFILGFLLGFGVIEIISLLITRTIIRIYKRSYKGRDHGVEVTKSRMSETWIDSMRRFGQGIKDLPRNIAKGWKHFCSSLMKMG